VARVIEDLRTPSAGLTVEDVLSADEWARRRARELVLGDSSGSTKDLVRGR
jgi:hypothetical protein